MSGPPAATGVYVAACLLLGAAGAAKVARPADTATALRGVGLPATARRVRVGAAVEVAVAVAGLAAPVPPVAWAVAASYGAFTAFVAVALGRRLPLATCGCFGRADTPPSWVHVAVDAACALAAAAWAVTGSGAAATRAFPHPELALAAFVATGLAAAVLTDPLRKVRA